ncbi:acetyltransferase-like isoleucine patch superfamily enzyme [Christiangramia gaetbulicola]|uniref:Acetyltransferase-like isoleucine patch superfamily enzyme n=1 Tax=Christiangramia gaetbulicola TaxID=703340 RepID=A0A2T6AFM7_9FLAO|nr:acyltransferase [Christiangramia gaetbulicola]PTX42623.1 acetyltransferase-like isoleucine patch superfamily enzyme [Christiangramia gaetbulicola]
MKPIEIIRKIPTAIFLKARIILYFFLFKISKNWVILNRISIRLRPAIWKATGCKIGKNVSIGYDIYYDVHNANLITIEDDVWIASRSLILCHKRDLKLYYKNTRYNDLSYIKSPVVLKRGCVVGMASTIMPGVTVGEGAIVGAGSLVVKDVPAWTIATGNPAKVVKEIKEGELVNKPELEKVS